MTGRRFEDTVSDWMKVLVPVMVAICMTLGAAIWQQSSTITRLETVSENRTLILHTFEKEDKALREEIKQLSNEIESIKTEARASMNTQEKVLNVVDRLSTTLNRLEVAMGKLETKLEYKIK